MDFPKQKGGYISCRIKGTQFIPVFSIGQYYSIYSLELFLALWDILSRKGNLRLSQTINGTIIITFSSESWNYITNLLIPYFNMTYGLKSVRFKKVAYIRELLLLKDSHSLTLAIHLMYSLYRSTTKITLTLRDLLKRFNLPLTNIKFPDFYPNTTPINLGFLLVLC